MQINHKLTLLPLICGCTCCYMPLWYFYIFCDTAVDSLGTVINGYWIRMSTIQRECNRFLYYRINNKTLKKSDSLRHFVNVHV